MPRTQFPSSNPATDLGLHENAAVERDVVYVKVVVDDALERLARDGSAMRRFLVV